MLSLPPTNSKSMFLHLQDRAVVESIHIFSYLNDAACLVHHRSTETAVTKDGAYGITSSSRSKINSHGIQVINVFLRFSLVKLEPILKSCQTSLSNPRFPTPESFRMAANSWLISRNAISLNERVLLVTMSSN